jgi:deoxyribose-phosphate aldolase
LTSPASSIDHTLLKPDTTSEQIRSLCEDAVEFGFASVCIPPVFVALAADLLYGSQVGVGTVVGFPLGYVSTAAKVRETSEAISLGATEIDMVIHLGSARERRFDAVEQEIRRVVEAAGSAPVKVILECCYWEESVKRALTESVVRAGAAYVKTSTGFAPGGATLEDVRLLSVAAAERIGVKAAGGIRSWPECRAFLAAGASRIGTSAGVEIVRQWLEARNL